MRTYKGQNPLERILSKSIINENGCIVFNGFLNEFGYGRLRANGKKVLVHRYVYEEINGKIPKDKLCCHSCDTPNCINPEHLFLGTHSDNIKDCIEKGRHKGVLNSPFKKVNKYHELRKTKVQWGRK